MLFVFVDDFLDVLNSGSSVEESTDSSSFNQSSGLSSVARSNAPAKGSGSVVVLARPVSKSEGGFRKKLQSSLEAQIRFLIKKCRTLSGSESGHTGSRSGAVSSSAPLFSLDASRSVVLLDRSANLRGESLEFATDLVEDILNGKATPDSLLLERHSQNANKEDILSIKEFIYRQSDILRGKGGLVTGTNSGSAAGVGMVAVAAAAAAASASAGSGKTLTTPELPSLEIWLSSSQLILNGILSAKRSCIDETEVVKRKPRQRNTGSAQVEGTSRVMDPLDVAVYLLENSRGLNTKFSTSWCEKALPTAKNE
jgi:protein SMG8